MIQLRAADTGIAYELSGMASGVMVWASYALVEAIRQLETELPTALEPGDLTLTAEELIDAIDAIDDDDLGEFAKPPFPRDLVESGDKELIAEYDPALVYIFDEPERHLHPLAQEGAARWICDLAADEGVRVVMATHSPTFLNLEVDEGVQYLAVRRSEAGITETLDMSKDVLGQLRTAADEYGIGPGEIIQLTKTILVVEGRHDEEVLKNFFSSELLAERAQLLPIHGTQHLNIASVEFLARFGKRIRILLDNVRANLLTGEPLPSEFLTRNEEKTLQKAVGPLKALVDEGLYDVKAVPFDHPDILFALPESGMRRLLDEMSPTGMEFPGWSKLQRAYRNQNDIANPKRFVLSALNLEGRVDDRQLVPMVLKKCPPDARPGARLISAVHSAFQNDTGRNYLLDTSRDSAS